ncbi:MAG TPA: helix-turn-helix domain-containing protein [Solirubrobacteraceae bacterium]|nr:helix-turn-helix domain-containing protein [Solirubrobacteraceae bacterium]
MAEGPVKRKYDATSRRANAAVTRERICAAAEELFVRDGYARTSIKAVARAAGVAEATVYLAFADKAALLDAAIVRATRDNASESIAAIAAAPPEEVLPRLAASNALLMARAGPLIALGESASFMDAGLRPLRERAHARLRAAFRVVADRLDEAGLLRGGPQEAADSLYAIASESTYLRMTEGAGLAPGRYGRWLGDTLAAVLLTGSLHGGGSSCSERGRGRA